MKNKIKPKGCIVGKDEFGKDFIAHCGCADCINRSEALLDLRKGYLEQINKIAELKEQIDALVNVNIKAQNIIGEAKELIRNLLRVTYGEGWNYSLDWKVKAEQFLKE